MTDISAVLHDLARSRRESSRREARELLRAVTIATAGEIAWDDEAGEDWATVMIGRSIAAYVLMLAPLVIVQEAHLENLRAVAGDSAAIISVRDMDEDVFRADRHALDALFGDRAGDLDASQFSATDLWFHSI